MIINITYYKYLSKYSKILSPPTIDSYLDYIIALLPLPLSTQQDLQWQLPKWNHGVNTRNGWLKLIDFLDEKGMYIYPYLEEGIYIKRFDSRSNRH